MSHIPKLDPFSRTWVAIRKRDGKWLGEFYNLKNVERFNPEKVEVLTHQQYLERLGK